MNNQEEAIRLSKKIDDILKIKRGILQLVFFDGKTIEVRLFQKQTTFNKDEFHCQLKTYTNDIKTLTEYDIYSIREIN